MGNVENNKATTSAYEASAAPTSAKSTKKKSREAFENSASASSRPVRGPKDTFATGESQVKAPDAHHVTPHAVGAMPPKSSAGAGLHTGGVKAPSSTQAEPKATQALPKPHTEPSAVGEGEAVASAGEAPAHVSEVAHPLSDDEAIKKSPYRLEALPNGEFRLQHEEDATRSYLVQIFPTAKLGAGNQKEVGEVIGKLLNLLALHENTYGGIKSVTFSGNGGQMVFGQHPNGNQPVAFGGDSNLASVKGQHVADLLRKLEELLGHCQLELRANREPKPSADDAKAKKAVEQTFPTPDGDVASAREADDAKRAAKAKAAKAAAK